MMVPMTSRTWAAGVVRGRNAFLLLAALSVAAGCSGSSDGDTAEAAVTTLATTTTEPEAPSASSTTAAPTTTATKATTTTAVPVNTIGTQESQPIAPPADSYATEPVIEMGTVSIPAIDVSMTMYEGIRMTTLDFGPGHWPGSALPGQNGNVVVAGHRTSNHKVFRDVDQLVAGDEIIFEDDNGRHVYAVTRIEIVEPTALWIVDPTETPTATLFACHPPGSTAQRIVVFADLIEG
jgi:sortase A